MLMIFLSMLESDEDRQYFLVLHSRYEIKMYQVALNILCSHALAEESVQESWLRIIRFFEKVKEIPRDKLEGYIVTIVKNTSFTIRRKENHTDPFPENWDGPTVDLQPTDEFHRLVELIRSMSERYREILEAKFVLGCSNQEIARQMGMNESTVASRISRGRKLLIAKMQEEGYVHE